MTPISITLRNFKSFRTEFTFEFPTRPGLYFMRGDNQAQPRLGGNGAGKSTLWDGWMWVSFDRTAKGLRGPDVAPWGVSKGVYVAFTYQRTDGTLCTVTRTWGPITWTFKEGDNEPVDLAKHESNPYLADLKLSAAAAPNCVLMGQGQPMFLDLKAEAKVSLVSEVLGLDVWLDYSDKAGKLAQARDRGIRLLEQRVADLQGQLRAFTAVDYTEKAAQWEREREDRLKSLEAQFNAVCLKEKAQITAEDNARLRVESAMAKYTDLANKRKTAERAFAEQQRERGALEQNWQRLGADYGNAKVDLENTIAAKTCPTCGGPINPTKHRLEIERIQARVRDLGVAFEATSKLRNRPVFRPPLLSTEQAEQEAAKHLREVEAQHSQLKHELQFTQRDLDRMEDEGERIENERNPFADMQSAQAADKEALTAKLEQFQHELDEDVTEHTLLSNWVRGFKDIRLMDMSTALTELEVEVNSSVSALGLPDWSINFALDRETAKGAIKRGFTVFVQSPDNQRPVPWESWSGGEAQRLRLAGTMGLSDLTRSRTGCTLELEVWDEPTDGLSPQGVSDLLSCLKQRAHDEGRQIWVVDHHALGYGAFDGVYTVVKTADGSQVFAE